MQFARTVTGERIQATPGESAYCPQCSSNMIAKCGEIVIHHWAHEASADCDPWWEPETLWHRGWKALMPDSQCEVTRGENHRADIVRADGVVVELQHSPISPAEIREREHAYSPMAWLFDGTDLEDRFRMYAKKGYYSFRWLHARPSYATCNQLVFLDLGDESIFRIGKLWVGGQYPGGRGWGRLHSYETFINWLQS